MWLLYKIYSLNLLCAIYLCWGNIDKIRNFTSDKGYDMLEGAVSFFFLGDCLRYDFKTCFALNADSPYGLFHLPPNPTETKYRGCVTKTKVCGDGCNPKNDSNLNTGICYKGYPMQWRVKTEEIILILGRTPPECIYWSITPYLMSSYYETNAGQQKANFSSIAQKIAVSCPDGPARCAKFASLYQPYNLMKFSREDNNKKIEFSKPFVAILSANKQMSEELSQFILNNFGIQSYIFKLPTDILKMGVEDDFKDMFTMLMRVAYPSNNTEMEEYYLNPPISVYRITPKLQNLTSDVQVYQSNDSIFTSRENGFKEGNNIGKNLTTYENLISGLEELKQKIIELQINKNSNIKSVFNANFLQPFFITGIDCLKDGTECNGDTPDTLYPISENIYISQFCSKFSVLEICIGLTVAVPIVLIALVIIFRKKIKGKLACLLLIFIAIYIIVASIFTNIIWKNVCHSGIGSSIDLENKDTYIIYGINHEKTNWARYSSVTAYHYEKLAGVHSASSQREYVNSAVIYLGKEHPLVQYFFVFRYSRNCTHSKISNEDNFCFDVPLEGVGSIPNDENIFFIERMYVNPYTQTGPIYEESISARVIHFR